MRAFPLVALLLLASVAGCVTPGAGDTPDAADAATAGAPPTVVAVVDSGINPYHTAFLGGPAFTSVPGAPDARALPVTLDAASYEAAVDADAALWESVTPGEIVRFPGTRVAGVSFSKLLPESPYFLLDDHGHGTACADAVVEASPNTVILAVQVADDEDLAPALRWVAAQAWIDVVSVSWGTWVEEYAEGEAYMGLPDAYRDVARAGKLLLNSAGNEPLPHMVGEHSGPPFVIAVGGVQNETRGDTRVAARFPDVVAAFAQERAVHHALTEREPVMGTSFSGPLVAGTLAEALWHVRDAVGAATGGTTPDGALVVADPRDGPLAHGRLTAADFRDAMNRRAEHWGPTDWSPSADPDELLLSNPVLAPAAQMGWGAVEPAHAPDIAAHLIGEEALPGKPADVVLFMQARERARLAAWGGV